MASYFLIKYNFQHLICLGYRYVYLLKLQISKLIDSLFYYMTGFFQRSHQFCQVVLNFHCIHILLSSVSCDLCSGRICHRHQFARFQQISGVFTNFQKIFHILAVI